MNGNASSSPRVALSTKARAFMVSLVIVATLGSGATLLYAWRTSHTVNRIISERLANTVTVAELDTALLRQRGHIAAFMMDRHDRKWLERQSKLEPVFRQRLAELEHSTHTPAEHALLARIRGGFERYDAQRDKVVELCDAGRDEEARRVYLGDLTSAYRQVTAASGELVNVNRLDIQEALVAGGRDLERLGVLVTIAALLTLMLGAGLTWLLRTGVFRPLRQLARDLGDMSPGANGTPRDLESGDLSSLGYFVRTLMSEMKSSRKDLARSRRELGHAKRLSALGNAVARLAHEIKNALVPIGGFARMIEKRPGDSERVVDAARTIARSASRLDGMIHEVLEFSRPATGELKPESVNAAVADALESAMVTMPPGIRVKADLDPAAPRVPLDPGVLHQVVANLVGNAVEAMGTTGNICVRTRASIAGAVIVVSDDGPGIPADVRRQIFDPFFTTKPKGNGLGLAICAQLVSDLGGDIRVESVPGQGATFTVELPDSGDGVPAEPVPGPAAVPAADSVGR